MKTHYTLSVAGIKRELKLCAITDDLKIGAFVIFGDVELTVKSAEALLNIAPQFDYLITAEAKGIPLVHEMARQKGQNKYFIARKAIKLYMQNPIAVEVRSITTNRVQALYIDKSEVEDMKGKRILIIDDVISTGESIKAVEKLVIQAGGIIAGKMAIIAEGDAKYRTDIITLEYLPLFNKEGEPILT